MKKENTIRQNVEFLLEMYKRELKYFEEKCNMKNNEYIVVEMLQSTIVELETILEFDN